MENISFQYPVWLVVFCILGALFYAGSLYLNSKKFKDKKAIVRYFLGSIRFLSVFLIAIFLLGPLLKKTLEEVKNPTVVVLQDVSRSVGVWLQGDNFSQYKLKLKELGEALGAKYEVVNYAFGSDTRLADPDSMTFSDPTSDLNKSLQYLTDIYEGENLGAIILASDGIYNAGKNPIYSHFSTNVPIFSIALGDTVRNKDLVLKRVHNSNLAYLNDQVSIQIDIQAYNSKNEFTRLFIEKKEKDRYVILDQQNIRIDKDEFFSTVSTVLNMSTVGVNHFRIRLNHLNEEANVSNNSKNLFIEVLDGRQKIGILAHSPHPDITALKYVLESNKNYEVIISYDIKSTPEIINSDLIIFHNLPTKDQDLVDFVKSMDEKKIPRIYVLGNQSNLTLFNGLQSFVSIQSQAQVSNEAQVNIHENFSLFNLDETLKTQLSRFPPLSSPFGQYKISQNATILFSQKIGGINTDFPLVAFVDQDGYKTTFIMGEGLWRWKLFDYLENENFNIISELINKSVAYTSTIEDKRKFRVSMPSNIIQENDGVEFTAELYNSSYELVNSPDVFLSINNSASEEFAFTFTKTPGGYFLSPGKMVSGDYSYKANTNYGGETFEDRGKFTVMDIQYELYNLEAKHNLLVSLASKYGGSVYYPSEIDQLQQALINDDRLKPVLYQQVKTKELIDLKSLFFIIITLLGIEWFLRRYYGSL